MRAMILAAGRGERMRPLTDHCPKPLLQVGGKSLIVYHIEKLVKCGCDTIVINHAWLGEQLVAALGDGSRWGITLQYCAEAAGALETAGGIVNALDWLGDEPFIVVNGDIWTDYDFAALPRRLENLEAHLVLVNNPNHNPQGDFGFNNPLVNVESENKYTFSGIAVYHPRFFAGLVVEKRALAPLLRHKMTLGLVSGEVYQGQWTDVGTPERLTQLNLQLEA